MLFVLFLPSVALTASEAVERSVRNAHDKHVLLSNLKQAEINVQTSQKEVLRNREELAQEKQKHKATYLEKLTAERKASELIVGKARAEVWTSNRNISLSLTLLLYAHC